MPTNLGWSGCCCYTAPNEVSVMTADMIVFMESVV
jgi:hypothetical protein